MGACFLLWEVNCEHPTPPCNIAAGNFRQTGWNTTLVGPRLGGGVTLFAKQCCLVSALSIGPSKPGGSVFRTLEKPWLSCFSASSPDARVNESWGRGGRNRSVTIAKSRPGASRFASCSRGPLNRHRTAASKEREKSKIKIETTSHPHRRSPMVRWRRRRAGLDRPTEPCGGLVGAVLGRNLHQLFLGLRPEDAEQPAVIPRDAGCAWKAAKQPRKRNESGVGVG